VNQAPGSTGTESGATGRRILTAIVGVGLVAMGVAVGIVVSGQLGGAHPSPTPPPIPSAAAATWQQFAPSGGAFAMDFPSSPTTGQQTLATGVGTATATSYSAFHGLSLFALSYADVNGLTGVDQIDATALTNGLLNGETGTVISATPANGSNYAGEVVKATAPGVVLTEQFFIAAQRLYVAVVSAPSDSPPAAADVDRFLSSFHVDVAAIPSPSPAELASVGPTPGASSEPSAGPSSSEEAVAPSTEPSASATPQPTPPIAVPHLPTGWQTWYSPAWHYVLGYPPDWIGTARDRFDSFNSPDGNVVILMDTALNVPARTLDQIASDDQGAIKAQTGWKYEATKKDRFGALPAVWISYHLVSSSGTPYEGLDIYALNGNVVLETSWIGPAQPNADQVVQIRQMLDTVTLVP
jgi:hypothetical protein